jgi:hypothetical protein
MSTKFDLSNDNGPTSNFFDLFFLLYDIKREDEEEEEGRKDP